MMTRYVHVCVFAAVMATIVHSLPAKNKEKDELEDGGCDKYKYCQGTTLPKRLTVMSWSVTCDIEGISANSTNSCCLPQQTHLFCNGIRAYGGGRLNYSNDTTEYLISTDFSDLCKHIVEAQGYTPGTYNSATFLPGGGEVAFRYGKWFDVSERSERHIRNLACGYIPA